MRIIIVDDNKESLHMLETLLKGKGYGVVSASNGAEALKKLRAQRFDMVIADILMPVMDGFQLCRECKLDPELGNMPFVFYTATYTDAKDEELALKLGADRFIRKPTEPEEFIKIIQLVISEAEKGGIEKKKPALEEQNDLFKLYNERLVKKLEKKMLDLDREVTERKRAEQALQESEERYRSLINDVVDSSKVGIFVLDSNFRVVWVNKALEQYFGLQRNDVIGKDKRQLIHERIKNSFENPEDFSSRVLATYDNNTYIEQFECHVLPGGNRKERWLEHWSQPIKLGLFAGGRIEHYTDITERKQAEEALKASEEQYRTLVENANEAIIVAQDGMLKFVNPKATEFTGYSRDELTSKPFLELIHPDDGDMVVERHLRRLEGEEFPFVYAFRIVDKEGDIKWMEINAVLIEWEGRPATLDFFSDITERKKAEERERQLQQELIVSSRLASIGSMASGIAHEINNPLTGVVGFSQLLLKQDIPDDIRESVKIIHDGAQRVAGITSRLLTFARQSKPERTYVNINDIIESTLALRSYEMRSSNIEATVELDPDLPCTMADAGQLQQVFLNIVLNAEAEMTRAHGRGSLLVKTERMDNAIRISFNDDGPGIPKENLDKIFDPFFTTREVGQGAGLGLSVSHGIVTGHGGRIYAQSELGKGATFVVELPIVTEAEQLKPVEPPAGELEKAPGGRILVVDDEPLVQQFLTRMLSEEGHEVDTTDNGDDALQKLQSEDYDVVLVDIKLPGMSGIEIYEHLQRHAKPLVSRVVFITGDVMSEDTMAFLTRAKAPYIAKPFDTEQLINAINTMLTRRG